MHFSDPFQFELPLYSIYYYITIYIPSPIYKTRQTLLFARLDKARQGKNKRQSGEGTQRSLNVTNKLTFPSQTPLYSINHKYKYIHTYKYSTSRKMGSVIGVVRDPYEYSNSPIEDEHTARGGGAAVRGGGGGRKVFPTAASVAASSSSLSSSSVANNKPFTNIGATTTANTGMTMTGTPREKIPAVRLHVLDVPLIERHPFQEYRFSKKLGE